MKVRSATVIVLLICSPPDVGIVVEDFQRCAEHNSGTDGGLILRARAVLRLAVFMSSAKVGNRLSK